MELNQSLCQFYVTEKNGKGEPHGFSSYVSLHVGLNCCISDPLSSRSWCLMKDPAFTKQQRFRWSSNKLSREGCDKTVAQLMAIYR